MPDPVIMPTQINNFNYNESLKDEITENPLERLSKNLEDEIARSDDEVDFSRDLETQKLINEVHSANPELFTIRKEGLGRPFDHPSDFIFSKEEASSLLSSCHQGLGKVEEEEIPALPNIFSEVPLRPRVKKRTVLEPGEVPLSPQVQLQNLEILKDLSEKVMLQNAKSTRQLLDGKGNEIDYTELSRELQKAEKTLNLNYHPTLEILQSLATIDALKANSIRARIGGNNDLLDESSLLVKLSSKFRKDDKESKGVDYSADEETQKLICEVHKKHPHILGSEWITYKFKHEEVEAIKVSAYEQSQIVMGRQHINKGYIENEMQEKNHLWELAHNIHKETTSSIQNILNNIKNAHG